MGTAKRERQKANRQARLEELARQSKRQKSKKRAIQIGGAVIGLLALFFVLAFLVGDDDEDTASTTAPTPTTAVDTTVPATTVPVTTEAPPETVPGRTITGATPCPAADGSEERAVLFEQPPPLCIDPEGSYTAEVVTNLGSFTIELDPAAAPQTVNNFVVLARYHYFDGTVCHRAIPGFVVQCGDPSGTGTGGPEGYPGYEFDDELPGEGEYQIGSIAMANAGPDTNGSQFFVITGEDGAGLPPSYSLFGQVVEGLDTTVAAMDALGNPDPASNGVPPLGLIAIESITITEG